MSFATIQSIVIMAQSTIMLIGMCLLGVTGGIETISSYRDTLVIVPVFEAAFAFGGMIVSSYEDGEIYEPGWVAMHEYGHLQQERQYGIFYIPLVVLPSLLNYIGIYRSTGIERDATERGAW